MNPRNKQEPGTTPEGNCTVDAEVPKRGRHGPKLSRRPGPWSCLPQRPSLEVRFEVGPPILARAHQSHNTTYHSYGQTSSFLIALRFRSGQFAMYAQFQGSYQRMEQSLQRLTDSIAAYNPSPTAAEELVAVDEEINKHLEQRESPRKVGKWEIKQTLTANQWRSINKIVCAFNNFRPPLAPSTRLSKIPYKR